MAQAIKVENERTILVDTPEVPFWIEIPGHVVPGTKVTIEGRPTRDCRRFSVNIVRGDTVDHFVEDNDIAFHYNPRFDHNCIVRNTRVNKRWDDKEEWAPHRMPFMKNVHFVMQLTVEQSCYRTVVNKSHFIDFEHRIPFQECNLLNIRGDVVVDRIRFESPFATSQEQKRNSVPQLVYSESEGTYLSCFESVPFEFVPDPDVDGDLIKEQPQ